MPYDPRMLEMAQMGVSMMGPPASAGVGGRPKQWWEQPVPKPARRFGQPNDASPNSPNSPGQQQQPQPSLLQMLMLGGKPTYSGTPQPGPNPWAWLGSMYGGGGQPR